MRPASTFREARRRRRRQIFARLFWAVAAIAIVIMVAVAGYEVGISKSRHEVALLESDLRGLNDKQYSMEIRTAEAVQRASDARSLWQDLQTRYQRDVPAGDMKELMEQLSQKIAGGVSIDRVRFVLDQLGRARICERNTETKRFMLRTSVTAGPIENVALVEGTIILSGEGEPFRNESGLAEAWYDVGEPVEIRFLQINGEITLAKGPLPLTHSIISGANEYIFLINQDERQGFVNVTAQTCAYP